MPLRGPLFRGARRLRIALVGLPNSGKSTFFAVLASTSVQSGALAGTRRAYNECAVQIGLDEARVIDLPSIRSPHHLDSKDRAALNAPQHAAVGARTAFAAHLIVISIPV